MADNGASQEGGPFGVMHEMKFFNGILETPDQAIHRIDDIGGPHSHTNYPWGWAQCGNSPFKWYKQNTHEGGVHVPMIVHWPAGIDPRQRGTKRGQFVNVADVVPTLYELLGVTAPETYNGIDQLPVTGHSFAQVLDAPDAPASNTLQYFEMGGSRALVAGDWKAVQKHSARRRLRHRDLGALLPPNGSVRVRRPGRSRARQARRTDRFVVVRSATTRRAAVGRPYFSSCSARGSATTRRIASTDVTCTGHRCRPSRHRPLQRLAGAASISPPASTVAGAMKACCGPPAHRTQAFRYSSRTTDWWSTTTRSMITPSSNPMSSCPKGDSTLTARFRRGDGRAGSIVLAVNGEDVGHGETALYMRMISSVGASVGYDHGSPVSARYDAPFAFTGTLHEVEIQLVDRRPADVAAAEAAAEMSRQ